MEYGHVSQSREAMDRNAETKGLFRVLLDNWIVKLHPRANYSPIPAGCFGGKKVNWVQFEKAMKGYILHRKLFPDEPRHHLDKAILPGHPYGFGNQFPDYGFDERFLKHVIYFEALSRDQLTNISIEDFHLYSVNLHPWAKADLYYLNRRQPIYIPAWGKK